ncbi:sigmaY antisigma factor component [Alicyclobacillus sp. ALC3]|uniref:sigmaY antisigma factor component n=1 Tax=Alicyclobacillus sp. ALC3 TaxID=2796143 RepID=UPI002378FDA6|nr:sigmaY antisigma factor component [Alicyclobacillus sp. ALC3]WDL98396.1 sigmaY antisigma factor component [Alicyclobacillus sp. ALC3]
MHTPGHLTWSELLPVILVLLVQGIWLFMDAKTRSRWPWLWGLWGLVQAPIPTVVYLLVVRKVWMSFRRPAKDTD